MKYAPIVGLEIHVQLKTKSKMFCGSKNNPDETRANVNVCPICLGHPGTLPVINKKAVKYVLKTALALNCRLPEFSKFDRKNYFYPDLPKGYQISQYDKPIARQGSLKLKTQNSKLKNIRIRRVHLEEDTGKLIHKGNKSLIDFNRAGIPLMEIVTEPDIRSAQEAKKFCQDLQMILRYLDVSDADMEKGQMRAEVNISLFPQSQISTTAPPTAQLKGIKITETNLKSQKLGTKVEIKNLNSFRAVERAIEYEIKRQSEILEAGQKVVQETRGWDEVKQITVSQRTKEEAHDYRYFPEPDLPPLRLKEFKIALPELPQAKEKRFLKEYKLPKQDIEILVKDKKLADYFEKIISELEDKKLIKLASNYLLKLKQAKEKITPENFAEFIDILGRGEISSSAAQKALAWMIERGSDPSQVIEELNLAQVSSSKILEQIIKKVIKNNPKAVADYKGGKETALQFLVGQVMAQSKGKANPQVARNLLIKLSAS